MTVNHFTNNINILHNKHYYRESLKNNIWKIILYYKKIETNTVKDNDYSIITILLNHFLLSTYLKQLGISIIKFEGKSIIIKYLEYELKLYIYSDDYDRTIRNLKFECARYSVDENIEKYLILFIDENWNLIIDFIDNTKTNNYVKVDRVIPNTLEVTLK